MNLRCRRKRSRLLLRALRRYRFADWMPEPEPLQPHDGLPWSCVELWPVVAVFPDVACEPTVLLCATEPSPPGLSTRLDTLVFVGSSCSPSTPRPTPGPFPPTESRTGYRCRTAQLHALPWSWAAVWPVVAVLPDVACEPALLPCVTEPSLPGLSTRTGRLTLDAPACAASESASASWSVPACCWAVWMPEPPAV